MLLIDDVIHKGKNTWYKPDGNSGRPKPHFPDVTAYASMPVNYRTDKPLMCLSYVSLHYQREIENVGRRCHNLKVVYIFMM